MIYLKLIGVSLPYLFMCRLDTLALARQPYLLETSLPGVFAVGDVRGGSIKRVASAVGEGAIAISLVHKVLQE